MYLKQSIIPITIPSVHNSARKSLKFILLNLLFIFLQNLTFSQDLTTQNIPAFPRLIPDPKAYQYFILSDINFSWRDLAEISLWASGNPAPSNIDRIAAAVTALHNSAGFPLSKKERAEYILDFMHRNYLQTYSFYQTRVDTIFLSGSYNCVSSAVLYMILCESAGINSSGVITREHAFVTVHIGGEDIDVETTSRYGFDPGGKREFYEQSGRLTGFAYVPAQNYSDRQTIGKLEFVSLILNNRIADFERVYNFTDAVPLAVDRAALLYGTSLAATVTESGALFIDPRHDLIDRLLNYGSFLLNSSREEDALRWVLAASSLYPSAERWNTVIHNAVNNRIARFLTDLKIQDAKIFLENNRRHLTASDYAEFNRIITNAGFINN